jgi:uncharacterized protein YhaN
VSAEELASLERNLRALEEEIQQKQSMLDDRQARLSVIAGADPQGRVEELEAKAADLDRKLAQEETRLAGLVLLDGLLTAERRRVSQLVSEPLNQRVSPWLSQIRGWPTQLVVEEKEGRIASIITERGGRKEELPFDELSEGAKEQVAFLVRLTLARLLANREGERHFVILDDPLTETSPKRRPEMFRILSQAAEDLQILFVTCHDDVLTTLPGEVKIHRL